MLVALSSSLPATATSQPGAPLVFLTGRDANAIGFGDSVLNGMNWAAQAFRQLNRTTDLMFVDQRTPGSGLQTCPG